MAQEYQDMLLNLKSCKDMLYVGPIHNASPMIAGEQLIDGFVREMQSLLPYKSNPYFIIPKSLMRICKSYVYWCRPDKLTNNFAQTACENLYVDSMIIKRTQLFYHHPTVKYYAASIELFQITENRFSYACMYHFCGLHGICDLLNDVQSLC